MFYSMSDDDEDEVDRGCSAMDIDEGSDDDNGQLQGLPSREMADRKTKGRPRCLIAFLTPRMAAKLFWQGVALCKLLDCEFLNF